MFRGRTSRTGKKTIGLLLAFKNGSTKNYSRGYYYGYYFDLSYLENFGSYLPKFHQNFMFIAPSYYHYYICYKIKISLGMTCSFFLFPFFFEQILIFRKIVGRWWCGIEKRIGFRIFSIKGYESTNVAQCIKSIHVLPNNRLLSSFDQEWLICHCMYTMPQRTTFLKKIVQNC